VMNRVNGSGPGGNGSRESKSTRAANGRAMADDDPRTRRQEARWEEEAAFFDRQAGKVDEATLPIDPLAYRRYARRLPRRRFNKEFRFRVLGDLEGKSLLDVGCGDGLNVAMFAKMGARVTGIDVSPGALEVARRRADANGVADRVRLICSPIETADLPDAAFDVVWGDGILHHVLEELEPTMRRLARWAKPGGLILFSEPINLFEPLRRLRRLIPVHTEATPGERPLVQSELDLVRRYVPDLRMRHYMLLGRLDRFILIKFNYERSAPIRRAAVNAINLIDYALLSLPGIRSLAGTCVLYGHPGTGSPAFHAAAAGSGSRTEHRAMEAR
jgi:2-polyprenyl-3-methyl-5-hydroxy-6-metoxy-1,4-benzoquinol methylase